ncbi:MAG TPA: rRNA maturation RNase YbeY [Candidatus Dormibacteraeota bacterium]
MLAPALDPADRSTARQAGLDGILLGALLDLGLGHAEVNCRLTTPAELRRLNRRFAGIDEATDVLAFSAGPDELGEFQVPAAGAAFLGDIAISVRTAADQAEAAGTAPAGELRLLALHGLLHLLGYDHDAPGAALEMTEATQALLDAEASRRGASPDLAPVLQPHR